MLHRIARASFHHRRLVVALWVLALIAAIVVARPRSPAGTRPAAGCRTPTPRPRTTPWRRDFPQQHGDEARIVFGDIQRDRPPIDAYLKQVAHVPGVISVESPVVSPGGTSPSSRSRLPTETRTIPPGPPTGSRRSRNPCAIRVSNVQFSGGWFTKVSMPASEVVGIIAAIIVLLVAFGSLIAMGLPILTALIGIAISLAGVGVMANVLTTPSFVPQVAAMVGIGVGIDYALFIVTRYRTALHRTGSPEAAVLEAMATSGRAVVFAGFTVMISVLGMLLIGLSFLQGLAVGTSLAAAVAVLAAITLLPALLGFVGFTIDRLHVGRRTPSGKESMWHRWARFVQRRPAAVALAGLAVLVVAALPAFAAAARQRRREQRSDVEHDAPGLRPHRQGVRARCQRTDPRRGRHDGTRKQRRAPASRRGSARRARRAVGQRDAARTQRAPLRSRR